MKSILDEIRILRNEENLNIERNNTNRYRIVVNETDGTKTAYYFAIPIYNDETKEIVKPFFQSTQSGYEVIGSNSKTSVDKKIRINSKTDFCQIPLPYTLLGSSPDELKYQDVSLYPTTNGIACKVLPNATGTYSFELECSIPFLNVKANSKSFSLLREKHKPFITISCIGSMDESGGIVSPAKIEYSKINDRKYKIFITASEQSLSLLFEVNMYELKLIQDTTVESANPNDNNAFGSVAFIGNTSQLGEQWLYSRFDLSNITGWLDKRVINATWYIPQYSKTNNRISAFQLVSHFCSFGSNWDNKVGFAHKIGEVEGIGKYSIVNVTKMFLDFQKQTNVRQHGVVLKASKNDNSSSAFSTADSYYCPQLIAIHYK